jgi:hypothetical protein
VPTVAVVTKWVKTVQGWGAECSEEEVLNLRKEARYRVRQQKAGRRSGSLPAPKLVRDAPMLSAALVELYERAGAPSVHLMQRRGGSFGVLPHTTVDRIIRSQTLPTSEEQCRAFLAACEVTPRKQDEWIAAWRRVVGLGSFLKQMQREVVIPQLEAPRGAAAMGPWLESLRADGLKVVLEGPGVGKTTLLTYYRAKDKLMPAA